MTGFPDKAADRRASAKMLIEVEAVRFITEKPFIFTSGSASPVYTIPPAHLLPARAPIARRFRRRDGATQRRLRAIRRGCRRRDCRHSVRGLDGGPADAADAIRAKKPKGFGRDAQIEGQLEPATACCGRGHDHRRPQQGQFLQRDARGRRHGRACLRVFLLRHLPEAKKSSTISASPCTRSPHGGMCWRSRRERQVRQGSRGGRKVHEGSAGWSKAHGGVAASGGVTI